MAFPTVADADTKNGVQASNADPWVLTYPTNLASGDLILALLGSDGLITGTATGFTRWRSPGNGNACTLNVLGRISDGTETGTFSVTIGASESGGWRVFRITGWFGSGLPAAQADINITPMHAAGLSIGGVPGASLTPNPPSVDPTSWDIEDTLWIAAAGVDTSRTFTLFPALYTNTSSDVSGGAGGASLGIGHRESAAASEDPGTFTISNSDDWGAATIAIRPAAGAPPAEVQTAYIGGGYYP